VFAYDAANRPLTKTFKRADGSTESTVTYSYDGTTHLLSSVNDSLFGTTTWTYDTLDRPYLEAGPNGTLTYTLNPAINRREGLQAASQSAISYGFDANDNVVSIAQNGTTDDFLQGWPTRQPVDRNTGQVVGEITTDSGPERIVRYAHTDRGIPRPHLNMEAQLPITAFYYLSYPDGGPLDPRRAATEMRVEVGRVGDSIDHFESTYAFQVYTFRYVQEEFIDQNRSLAGRSVLIVPTTADDWMRCFLRANVESLAKWGEAK
jgi:hypothetical protein